MQRIVEGILSFLCKRTSIDEKHAPIYMYGIDIAVYTFFSTLAMLGIGILLNRTVETLTILLVYYVNQTLGGGFHARSHVRCFLIMMFCLLIGYVALLFIHSNDLYLLFAFLSITFMFCFPVILHRNKAYLEAQKRFFAIRMRVVLLVELLLLLMLPQETTIQHAFCLSLVFSALSKTAAVCGQHIKKQ